MMKKTNQWRGAAKIVKRIADIFVSLLFIILFAPIFACIAILVYLNLGSPILYKQERVGQHFNSFQIYKFRSMPVNAEPTGPQLSVENDERLTSFGKTIRKWRFDELPQFWNVLKGDMSIVGPRPERAYYVNQLQQEIPNYNQIMNVKPGITSAGMVNYGYASSVEEMKDRVVYDLNYIENLSLQNDLILLVQTVKVLIDGSGK